MAIAYLGLGANLGERLANLRTALEHLESTGEVEVLAVSTYRETAPEGGPSQPRYLNAAARIRTEAPPERLLHLLKEAEKAAGRVPTGVRWGPREADLDLLLYEDVILTSEDLTIPHPLFRARRFALEPLAEIAPDAVDPVTGKTVADLYEELLRRLGGKHNARLIQSLTELGEYVAMLTRNRFSIGLVPTMGALHEGHLSLIRGARECCDKVVVSLFVNPTQFGAGEDLESYPRQLDEDRVLASDAGADVVFAPSPEAMYPPGAKTWVFVEGLSEVLCGASRPTHFRGVTTIVAKLVNLVRPDFAFFGQKDFQQTVVIRRMVRDLNMGVEVRVLPTVREPDGLALSSRNRYLSAEERKRAACLFRSLSAARDAHREGERSAEALIGIVGEVLTGAGVDPEYVAVVDAETLEPLSTVDRPGAILVAARVGPARLIDNVVLGEAT
jgi:pantoate--beta-alanine ligase